MQHRSAIVPVLLLLASACGVQTADAKPLKVFILAGQSNMDGQANVSTIDFLGEDKKHSSLLKVFKPDGKTLITREDVWVASEPPLFPAFRWGGCGRNEKANTYQ